MLRFLLKFLPGVGVGAALLYFLDPDRGRRRRALARDRARSLRRHGARRAEKTTRHLGGIMRGVAWRARHPAGESERAFNDETLAQKVASVIFRDRAVPKGQINVNAEGGVIVLRGQVSQAAQIKELEDKACTIPGVLHVENLLHLPNMPPAPIPSTSYIHNGHAAHMHS